MRLRRGVAGLRAGPEPGASAERASVIRMGPAHALRQHLTGKRSCRDSPARCAQEPKGQTSIEKLARHFHLPINAAGRELGICPTVLKKICRKHGLTRWPHRKVCAALGRARLSGQGSSPVGACRATSTSAWPLTRCVRRDSCAASTACWRSCARRWSRPTGRSAPACTPRTCGTKSLNCYAKGRRFALSSARTSLNCSRHCGAARAVRQV